MFSGGASYLPGFTPLLILYRSVGLWQDSVTRHLPKLQDVLEDLAAAELGLAELTVAEDVRDLDGLFVPAPRHHLEPDLEPDGVELHAVDGRLADREEAGRAV